MLHCFQCGADLPDNLFYCLHCGARLDGNDQPTVIRQPIQPPVARKPKAKPVSPVPWQIFRFLMFTAAGIVAMAVALVIIATIIDRVR